MRNIFAEITVKNAVEATMAMNGQMDERNVHSVTFTVVVDTSATTLVINTK
jgi:type VI protein secretion system component Hcp